MGEVKTQHPLIVKTIKDNKIKPFIEDIKKVTRRQDLSKAYFPYGVSYLVKTSYFEEKKLFYSELSIPYFIERWQNYEVDDIYDFLCIETILNYKKNDIL